MHTSPNHIMLELDQVRLGIAPALGCSIRSLELKSNQGQWADVFRKMPEQADAAAEAGSFCMLPWTNRIKDARFEHTSEHFRLQSNCDDGSAIHGSGRDLPWKLTDRSPISARFVLDSRLFDVQRVNFPFAFGAVQRFEIAPTELHVELSITNLDSRAIPVGCGHHPYISRRLFDDHDELSIQTKLDGRYPTQACIPTNDPIFDDVCQSLEAGKPVGNPGLDDVFSGFGGQAVFNWSVSGIQMTMRCSKNLGHLVVYTPTMPDGQADAYVCVEPVSMVNDGFNRIAQGHTNTGVQILKPNETMQTTMSLFFETLGRQ